ncbi:MAG: CDP-diacylglycerol--serine O-phosphatidyltransferase [Haliscomenobacter sp.]|nr:CDP-diacylglycerol--serine O-phosphatidyltransferase [Haliscomenobacter sp.]MBK7474996.1 CDP-diacylglycerol--serine O-phosphatidyltransferase [Haliscomenobacter sp.]MBK8880444.1 CDP-diacylglycerol--serine O-phosphatidyltransferase [Haliscomenobacter sp.]
MKKAIPNAITLANLLAGMLAVVFLVYGQLKVAVGLVLIALFADFLDGAVARWLKVNSPLGKELDSLADVVSFGVAPGVMLYGLISAGYSGGAWPSAVDYAALPAFLLAPFAALRLGKFNLDERQSEAFIGLPTPASALFVCGLVLLYLKPHPGWAEVFLHPLALYAVTGLLSALMIAEIPMFSLKMKHFGWAGNEIKYIFAGISLVLLALWRETALTAIILLYISLSIGLYLSKRKN